MKKFLLGILSFSSFLASAQVEIEPFAPTVPGTYIGGFDVTPLTSVPGTTAWTTEGTGTGSYPFVGDNGATVFGYVGSVGNYCAVGLDVAQTLILVSPEMDFGANTTNPTLNFRWGQSQLFAGSTPGAYCSQSLEVLYKESSGGAWNVLTTITALDPAYTWHDEVVDLSAASNLSTFYIGFRVNGLVAGSFYGIGLTYGQTVIDQVVITGEAGCSATTSSITTSACMTYTVPSGDETYTSSGIVMDTIPNMSGCDSVMTIDVTITNPNTTVSVSGATLTAAATGVNYQWMNCSDSSMIASATSQNYTATANGDYAVIIDDGGCIDTSACSTIAGLGLKDNDLASFKMYPNPTNGSVFIQLNEGMDVQRIEVYSTDGKLVMSFSEISANLVEFDISQFTSGIYTVKVVSEVGAINKILVKK